MKTKTVIVFGLCAALLASSVQPVRTQQPEPEPAAPFLYLCLVGGGAIIGGVVTYVVKKCSPKYYCMTDSNGNRFYSNAGRTEREVNDWTITGGPYDSAEEAAAGCVVTPPAIVATTGTASTSDESALTPFRAATLPADITMAQLIQAQYNKDPNPNDQVPTQMRLITIEKTTNMVTWFVVDQIMDDPDNFFWADTNGIMSSTKAFYRAY